VYKRIIQTIDQTGDPLFQNPALTQLIEATSAECSQAMMEDRDNSVGHSIFGIARRARLSKTLKETSLM
jgi:hypothetical protein